MDRAKKYLKMEMYIKVNTKMEDLMDLEHINGKMAKIKQFTKEISRTVLDMEKVNGHKTKLNI